MGRSPTVAGVVAQVQHACLEPEPQGRPTIADAVGELDAISG